MELRKCDCGVEDPISCSGTGEYVLLCTECGTRTPFYKEEDEAIVAWNTREVVCFTLPQKNSLTE